MHISGPYTHQNLVLFLVHGPSRPGPVPMTLEEALAAGKVRLKETGVVSELSIDNESEDGVFIQSGDIVKGGRQDRVLKASVLIGPKSPAVAVSALCVESGRWSARGMEDAGQFSASPVSMHDRAARSALKASYAAGAAARAEQAYMWHRVAVAQDFLGHSLNGSVKAHASPTSLQLSLQNADLARAQGTFMDRLLPLASAKPDTLGMAWAVNGRLSGAEIYASHPLFLKMWAKNLKTCATEAIGAAAGEPLPAPELEAVQAFLAAAENGELTETRLPGAATLATRTGRDVVFCEARGGDGQWVHRSYVAAA